LSDWCGKYIRPILTLSVPLVDYFENQSISWQMTPEMEHTALVIFRDPTECITTDMHPGLAEAGKGLGLRRPQIRTGKCKKEGTFCTYVPT
jgi:hypothetical protein